MQGAAHTATTLATTQLRALQQWQQLGKSREPARLYPILDKIFSQQTYTKGCYL